MKLTNSLLEKLDPRTKIISFLLVILCMILTPITRIRDFGLYFLLIVAIGFFSKITPRQILKKVCILVPFVLFIAMFVPFIKEGNVCWSLKINNWKLDITYEGVWTFLNIIVKSTLSIFLLVIATSTTTFPDFLKRAGHAPYSTVAGHAHVIYVPLYLCTDRRGKEAYAC